LPTGLSQAMKGHTHPVAGAAGILVLSLIVAFVVSDLIRRHGTSNDSDFRTLPYDLRAGMTSEMRTNGALLAWLRRHLKWPTKPTT
jgi:hypothetical protein